MANHVRKYLDVSAAHMTEQDNDLLAKALEDGDKVNMVLPHTLPYSYGNWVWVPDAEEMESHESMYTSYGFSPAFVGVLKYARENDCDWVNFDRDGEVCEDLPTHEW